MSDRSVWRILHNEQNLHPYKLQIVHSFGTKRYACNFVISFREYWLKIQTSRTTCWEMRHIFSCMAQLISRAFDTGQVQILTNFTNAPLMTQIYLLVCCLVQRSHWTLLLWGWRWTSHHSHITTLHRDDPWISSPKSSTKPYLMVSTRWCMAHTAVISMAVLRCLFPQWVISRFGDVPWPPRLSDQTAADFFLWVIWRVKCTVFALQMYMHSSKQYEKKSPKFQKKYFDKLCASSQLVCTCAFRRVVAT
jgi:hypothetical protein